MLIFTNKEQKIKLISTYETSGHCFSRNDVVEKRSTALQRTNRSAQRLWHQARVVLIVDHGCNVTFTCFCKFYLFLFPILCECTLVKCHCGIFIELASSTIGQRAKRVLGHRAKLGQCAKFGQSVKSRRRQQA